MMAEINPFHALRLRAGFNLKQTADFFCIPYRTIQNWDAGINDCPPYLLKLMEESLIFHGIIKEQG